MLSTCSSIGLALLHEGDSTRALRLTAMEVARRRYEGCEAVECCLTLESTSFQSGPVDERPLPGSIFGLTTIKEFEFCILVLIFRYPRRGNLQSEIFKGKGTRKFVVLRWVMKEMMMLRRGWEAECDGRERQEKNDIVTIR